MKGLETLEQQMLFMKAIGNVMSRGDFVLVKDSSHITYGSDDGIVLDFGFGFSVFKEEPSFGDQVIEECKKLGLNI